MPVLPAHKGYDLLADMRPLTIARSPIFASAADWNNTKRHILARWKGMDQDWLCWP